MGERSQELRRLIPRETAMHLFGMDDRRVLSAVTTWIMDRIDGLGLVEPTSPEPLPEVRAEGIGLEATWSVLSGTVLPSSFPTDHPRYLAFVGGAPSPASIVADAALSAAAVYGGSELEAGAVVAAERAAIRWLCGMFGYPDVAHGAFVSGGSAATLSALVAARHGRELPGGGMPSVIVAAASVHSSVWSAASIMGCRVVTAGSPDHPVGMTDLAPVLDGFDPAEVVAVVVSAGATNTGVVDVLDEISAACTERGLWLHVDAAYGGPAVLSAQWSARFAGIEHADSITVDPHKWLFTPIDCAAVLYRDPARARAAHRQHADYLDAVNDDTADNPSDYSVQLTRRARGLPLWASLVANGADAYVAAVEQCLATTDHAVRRIEASEQLELALDVQLSVVLFRRIGWSLADYTAWSEDARRHGLALVTPTTFRGQPVLRLCFVNPRTTTEDVDKILASLECDRY